MRRFWSYGPPNIRQHYYAPRQDLIDEATLKLVGEDPEEGGHYITVWAPRQRGKSWLLQQVMHTLRDSDLGQYLDVVKINLEALKTEEDVGEVVEYIVSELNYTLKLPGLTEYDLRAFESVFKQGYLQRPLILILDEFDALKPQVISGLVGIFRNLYNKRLDEGQKPMAEREILLQGVALIGVRAVLGIENQSGSPFNVQRSLHIPNLTFAEVEAMFNWYEREHGQNVELAVIEQVFYQTQGQPGLVGWLGELLTETYNKHQPSITLRDFEMTYALAINTLPNSNILNIISKAKQEPYQDLVLRLFQTDEKLEFRYDGPETNFLYMNGVIDVEVVDANEQNVKFPCPFVQKRLFNYFASQIFGQEGQLYPPFTEVSLAITETDINIAHLLKLHEAYIQKNKGWLYKNAPRRIDLRLYEAVYHFNLYTYLHRFVRQWKAEVWPEFPTGNGKVDILIRHARQMYAVEVKSFKDDYHYQLALRQATDYADQLGVKTITLVLFIEAVDEANRRKYETVYSDTETGVVVEPRFVVTG